MIVAVIFLAAFVATSLMTAFSYLISKAFRELYKEPVLLQFLMTRFKFNLSPKQKAIAGWIIHYTIGLFFVIAWYTLWRLGLFELTWISTLIFGCVIGITGIFGWIGMFLLADYKPKIDFKGYYLQLFFAHLIFAIAAWFVLKGFLL